jgi:ATP-dependent Clp protease adapter protein ClpS
MPTFSESLELSLQRAIAIAGASHHEYTTLEHLLLALTDDAEAAAVLHACNVDLEKLRLSLVSFIDSELAKFETGRLEISKPSAAFQRVVQRAVTHVQSTTRREEVTAANVLVAILTERGSQASAALAQQAMTRYDATLYICHGISKAHQLSPRGTEAAAPGDLSETTTVQAKVLLLNDDYTPMEFVVQVLERVFEKDRGTATKIMLETHNNGIETCGLYPYNIASTKVSEVLDLSREQQHPLQCVLEQGASI